MNFRACLCDGLAIDELYQWLSARAGVQQGSERQQQRGDKGGGRGARAGAPACRALSKQGAREQPK
eukprot:jgi/Chlat1/7913/Chrsp68S07379